MGSRRQGHRLGYRESGESEGAVGPSGRQEPGVCAPGALYPSLPLTSAYRNALRRAGNGTPLLGSVPLGSRVSVLRGCEAWGRSCGSSGIRGFSSDRV